VCRPGRGRGARHRRLTQETAARAVAEDRLVIARELHDAVSGNLGAITVRCAVARRLETTPDGLRTALDDVDIEIEREEFVFLVGASGSGKSTFLRLTLREERPTSGRVHVLGRDLSQVSTWKVPQLRREMGFVFQDFRLLENKTVLENVALASQVIGKPRHYILSAVPEALDLVGLSGKEKRQPHELSGGEQQRVAIARAMVNRPKLLLADEPTGNLDPSTSVGIMRLLDRINRQGTTVVMATHDDEIVDQMRKRVIELKSGAVVRDQARGVYGSDR